MRNVILNDLDVLIERATEKLNKTESKEEIAYWNGYLDAVRDAKSDITIILWGDDE